MTRTQIVCAECGATNEAGEDFCGECGSYLEWEGAAVATAPEPEAAPEPVAEPAPRSVVERVKAAVGIGDEPNTDEAAPPVPPEQRTPPDDTVPTGTTRPASPPTAQPVKPVAAVRPGAAAPKPRKRPTAPLDQPLQPGDLVCGDCGAGNKPTRKFCRRCGHDLAEAEVARIPWWRRVVRRRPKAVKTAGTRPKQRRRLRMPPIGRYLAILVVLAGIAYLTKPIWSPGYETVLDRVKGVEPVTPTGFSASSSARGHGPGAVRDGATNRYWAPAVRGHARGQFIEMSFDAPTRLVYLRISTGVAGKAAPFLASGRPTRIRATMFSTDGSLHTKEFRLEDKPAEQQRRIASSDVEKVRITILQSHLGTKPGTLVGISEVQLYQRK